MAVRRHRIDTVIDMEFFSRASAIFAFLTGAATRVGLHRFTGELPYRGNLMTHRIQYLPQLHISTQYSVLVEAAFSDPADEPMLKVPLDRIRSTSPQAAPAFAPTTAEIDAMRARLGSPHAVRSSSSIPTPAICCRCENGRRLALANWRRASSRRIQARSSC